MSKKSRDTALIEKRNLKIYEMYSQLWGEGLREELIWPQISEAFYLQENTIYRIVLDQTKVTTKNQLDLFIPPANENQ